MFCHLSGEDDVLIFFYLQGISDAPTQPTSSFCISPTLFKAWGFMGGGLNSSGQRLGGTPAQFFLDMDLVFFFSFQIHPPPPTSSFCVSPTLFSRPGVLWLGVNSSGLGGTPAQIFLDMDFFFFSF